MKYTHQIVRIGPVEGRYPDTVVVSRHTEKEVKRRKFKGAVRRMKNHEVREIGS